MRRRSIGPYQLQAAIASTHNAAGTWRDTDWVQIAQLYGLLASVDPSPVVALNRSVAIGFAQGFAAGLAALDAIDPEHLPKHHLMHAARAEMLDRLGRRDEAAREFQQALRAVISEPERRHLERRLAMLSP
jgi:RNA polymerase sigma-70 factor (ECF subfamily)